MPGSRTGTSPGFLLLHGPPGTVGSCISPSTDQERPPSPSREMDWVKAHGRVGRRRGRPCPAHGWWGLGPRKAEQSILGGGRDWGPSWSSSLGPGPRGLHRAWRDRPGAPLVTEAGPGWGEGSCLDPGPGEQRSLQGLGRSWGVCGTWGVRSGRHVAASSAAFLEGPAGAAQRPRVRTYSLGPGIGTTVPPGVFPGGLPHWQVKVRAGFGAPCPPRVALLFSFSRSRPAPGWRAAVTPAVSLQS